MQNRPTHGIQSKNRIQYETTAEGSSILREYWIHEWDGKSYDVHEHINDIGLLDAESSMRLFAEEVMPLV